MVDFSKRDEVKRWLDAIEPAERRREVAVAMAARAALRGVPLLAGALNSGGEKHDEILSTCVAPILRAAAAPWVATEYPNQAIRLRSFAADAGSFDSLVSLIVLAPFDPTSVAAKASVAQDAGKVAEAAKAAAFSAAFEANDAIGNAAFAVATSEGRAEAAVDAALIESGRSAAELAGAPLWPKGPPRWAEDAWRALKSALLAADRDWNVWIDWYEARLAGDVADPPNEALEVARATIPDEIWKQGPAAANAEVKRLIELHTPKSTVSVSIAGAESRISVGDVVPSIALLLQGVDARASAGEAVSKPEPPPAGWMNSGDDPAVQLAAQTRLQARAAAEAAFVTQPPFSQPQVPTAGTAPQPFGGTLPKNLPSIETIPSQERAATQFRADAEGRIDVVRIPPARDELQRFHYDEMRHKATAMVALGQMLGDLASPTSRILEALPERMEDASVDKLWSRANTLRRRHDAHVRAIDYGLGPNPARLDDLAAATLGDFVDSFNIYVLGDPRALELDSARLVPQDREAVRRIVALAVPIAGAASDPQVPATAAAQEALAEQVDAAVDAPDDINGDQAADLARKTTGNFVSELLRQAYAPVAKLKAFAKDQPRVASKAVIEGFYREGGKKIFDGMPGAASATWRTIADFVVANAESLKEFVAAQFHNPALIDIINWIKNLHDWF
jgi:hypothetical protein